MSLHYQRPVVRSLRDSFDGKSLDLIECLELWGQRIELHFKADIGLDPAGVSTKEECQVLAVIGHEDSWGKGVFPSQVMSVCFKGTFWNGFLLSLNTNYFSEVCHFVGEDSGRPVTGLFQSRSLFYFVFPSSSFK